MNKDLQPNNFDLLRLLAALQVVCGHAFTEVSPRGDSQLLNLMSQFPGVPVFFFVSGFLISASWERLAGARDYASNRAHRIFPAYWLVTMVSLFGILAFSKRSELSGHYGTLILWLLAQLSMFPQWNPAFLRSYGIGVVNGSLWTIPVELCFYASTPVLYWLFRKVRRPNTMLIAVIVLSFAFQYADFYFHDATTAILFKALRLTPIPWIGIFALGILAQRKFDILLPLVKGKLWLFAFAYLLVITATYYFPISPLLAPNGQYPGTINTFALCGLSLAFAYTGRNVANTLLKRNDISYGIYLLHMPIANMLLASGVSKAVASILMILIVIPAAIASWYLVERPILALRKRTIYRHSADRILESGALSARSDEA